MTVTVGALATFEVARGTDQRVFVSRPTFVEVDVLEARANVRG